MYNNKINILALSIYTYKYFDNLFSYKIYWSIYNVINDK